MSAPVTCGDVSCILPINDSVTLSATGGLFAPRQIVYESYWRPFLSEMEDVLAFDQRDRPRPKVCGGSIGFEHEPALVPHLLMPTFFYTSLGTWRRSTSNMKRSISRQIIAASMSACL